MSEGIQMELSMPPKLIPARDASPPNDDPPVLTPELS